MADRNAPHTFKAASEATRAAQQAATAGGISFDKARLAEDRPTTIARVDRDADDIIESLQKLAPGVFTVIDGHADEITPAVGLPPGDDPVRRPSA